MLVMQVGTLITNWLLSVVLSVGLVSVAGVFILKSDVCDSIGGYSLLMMVIYDMIFWLQVQVLEVVSYIMIMKEEPDNHIHV